MTSACQQQTGTERAPDPGFRPRKTKRSAATTLLTLVFVGRGGGIRTRDPLHPMQVRYQAALHPDEARIIARRGAHSGGTRRLPPTSSARIARSSLRRSAASTVTGKPARLAPRDPDDLVPRVEPAPV